MHARVPKGIASLCVLFVIQARGVVAQDTAGNDTVVVSLEEARARAIEANPELAAASWVPTAAQGDVRGAGLLQFNPDAEFEARSPGAGFGSRFEAQVGVQLEVAGQRGLRLAASEAAYESERSSFRDEGRLILAEVGRAYHALVAAEQRSALAEEIDGLNARLLQAVTTQLTEGEVSALEANLARIEAARARARALEASSARATAALELGRLLGLAPEVPLRTVGVPAAGPSGPEATEETLVRLALSRRPDLRALEHEAEEARQEVRLAGRESLPDLRVAALATREDPLQDARFGVAVAIELPLFNRNQGLADRRRAELAAVEQSRRAIELRVRTEVEKAMRAYASAQREVEILEAEMLGPIRVNQALLEVAYLEGKIDLASLLMLRNQLLDAELSYWAAWERREMARTDLNSATGEILRGADFVEGGER